MTKLNVVVVVSLLFVCSLCCSEQAHAAIANITLKVVDEESKPVEDASITICFKGGCLYKEATTGKTNKDGIYSNTAFSSDGMVGGEVIKRGYYESSFHADFIASKLGFWLPYNKEITVVLRPIINPVPMYVRNRSIEIPYLGKDIGFDLMKFDWVIPYGQGVKSDFIFRADLKFEDVDNFDATLTMTFTGENDGIQLYKEDRGGDFSVGSRFRLPRYAPETGYQSKLIKRMYAGPSRYKNEANKDNNHFFRVRTEVDANGKLHRAMYGKIKEDVAISLIPEKKNSLRIHMLYYLNPDYTRNLEFDPTRNLFGPLLKGELPIGLP